MTARTIGASEPFWNLPHDFNMGKHSASMTFQKSFTALGTEPHADPTIRGHYPSGEAPTMLGVKTTFRPNPFHLLPALRAFLPLPHVFTFFGTVIL